jgi:hypothetical protein
MKVSRKGLGLLAIKTVPRIKMSGELPTLPLIASMTRAGKAVPCTFISLIT